MAIQGVSNAVQTTTSMAQSKISMSKDDFLKILIEQIKHQDPMDPMKPEQFLGQLSQLTQVEQLQNIAGSLEAMKNLSEKGNLTQWLSAMGKKINVEGNILSNSDEVVLEPSGDYDSIMLALKNTKDGNITEVHLTKGDSLTYTNQGTDDVLVSAVAVKDNKMIDCKINTFRTVKGIVTSDTGYQMVAGNGDRYPVATIKQIKN